MFIGCWFYDLTSVHYWKSFDLNCANPIIGLIYPGQTLKLSNGLSEGSTCSVQEWINVLGRYSYKYSLVSLRWVIFVSPGELYFNYLVDGMIIMIFFFIICNIISQIAFKPTDKLMGINSMSSYTGYYTSVALSYMYVWRWRRISRSHNDNVIAVMGE